MVEYILVTFSKVLIQQFLFNISFVLKHACSHEKKINIGSNQNIHPSRTKPRTKL